MTVRLAYQPTTTTVDQQDEHLVHVVSLLTYKELQGLVVGMCRANAPKSDMRAAVARAVASGHYLVIREA